MRDQPQGDLRGLKALVGIMGVLIVLGTALVIGVVIHRIYARTFALPSMVGATTGVTSTDVTWSLGSDSVPNAALVPGEHIAGIAGASGGIAIWVEGPAGGRVLILDPATGQIHVALTAPK